MSKKSTKITKSKKAKGLERYLRRHYKGTSRKYLVRIAKAGYSYLLSEGK